LSCYFSDFPTNNLLRLFNFRGPGASLVSTSAPDYCRAFFFKKINFRSGALVVHEDVHWMSAAGDRFAGDGWAQRMWLATVTRTPRMAALEHTSQMITCFLI
jgi:hypothetical protein